MKTVHPTTTFPQHDDDHWGPFVRKLSESIADTGHDVTVLTANTPDARTLRTPVSIKRFDYFIGKRYQTLMTPPGLIPNLKNHPWRAVQLPFYYRAMGRAIRRASEDADLVHAHWLIPSGVAAVRNTEKPVLATVWGAEYHVDPDGMMGKLVRYAQRHVDQMVAVSDYLREKGIAEFGCDPDKITTIPNAVDTDQFRPDIASDIREQHNIPQSAPLITTIRRLVPEKRVQDLISALPTVLAEEPDTHALIVGDGPERDRLEEQVAAAGIEDNVTFTGYVAHREVPKIFAASDIAVMTTEQEGMATALLEGMATETATVATDAVGNGEVLGDAGRLYPKGDIAALSEALVELVEDPARREKMGVRGRDIVKDRFSYDVVADQYVELYEKLI